MAGEVVNVETGEVEIVELTAEELAAYQAGEAASVQAEADLQQTLSDIDNNEKIIKALALAVLDELQALGSTTTPAEFKQAIKSKYLGL